MDLTPDQITSLILDAYEKGIARGRDLATAEASAGPQVFVRPGHTTVMGVDLGSLKFTGEAAPAACTHARTTRVTWPASDGEGVVNGPTQCNDCGQIVEQGDTL